MSGSDDEQTRTATIELPEKTYFKIGEVAKLLEVEPYVLRYWETEFDVLDPEKTKSGQRVYQRSDIELLLRIQTLLYEEMFTIAGARRQLSRRREGKSSYFDLQDDAPKPKGTAVAGDEELREELEAARRELAATQTELNEVEQHLVDAREEAAAREKRLDELSAQLDEARQQLEQQRRREDELGEENERLQQQLRQSNQKLQERPDSGGERVAELRDEVEHLERRLEEVREESESRKQQIDKIRDQRKIRRNALGSLRREVENLATLADSAPRTAARN